MASNLLYFGYGSNLNQNDWVQWCMKKGYDVPALMPVEAAWLPAHSLRLHYRSIGRGGGAADVVPDQTGTAVPGMLFSLDEEAWGRLDEKEGHPRFYRRCPVQVVTKSGTVTEAITYVVVPERKRGHLVPPSTDYYGVVLEGLKNHDLPIEHLKKSIEIYEANSTLQHVFVYGTLMEGEQRWSQMRPWSAGSRRGTVSGSLYHLGAYPGMQLGDAGEVHGELHRVDDIANALSVFDQIEGCDPVNPRNGLYLRLPVNVCVEDKRVWAWAYVINQLPSDAKQLEDGRWVN